MAKLAIGDMVATDAQYHAKCLAKLYKQAELSRKACNISSSETLMHGIAFAELVSYIESYMESKVARPVFEMGDLKNLYISRLSERGEMPVHTTRLKNRILAAVPDLRSHTAGMFYFRMTKISEQLLNRRAMRTLIIILARASTIILRDVLKLTQAFDGRFAKNMLCLNLSQSW